MIPFVHLHVHSQYSILDGQSTIKSIVDKAIDNGMRGVALTDHGNMFGIKEFFDYTEKINGDKNKKIKELKKQLKELGDDADAAARESLENEIAQVEASRFKPIFGCEAYVARKSKEDQSDKNDKGYHLILLAKNYQGYKNLIKIVSRAWIDGFYWHPRTDKADLEKYSEGIICCSACLGGEVPQHIMRGDLNGARELVRWFKRVFGEDYYLELQRHKATVPRANHETFFKQQEVNAELLKIAREEGIKLICSNDSHFTNEDDADAHERLICVNTGKKINEENSGMSYTKQEWFKTQEEMNEVFGDVPEALQNTNEILDKVEFYSIDHAPILPDFPLPEGFETEDDYLRYLVYEGAKKVWPDMDDEHRERLDFELETIKKMGFPGYFLIVQDYIGVAPSLGVSVGPGRGSAAGSAVAYCLGITKIDPIKYDLLFERFLNPDRISLPDIDVDFDDDGRAVILKYVTEKYGAEKVAHIITYGTMAAKMAIKDVARVEDLSVAESNRLAKFIPSKPGEMPQKNGKSMKISIKNCLEAFPDFAKELNNEDPRVGETIRFAEKLEGNVRNTGVHACGVIIGRDDITDRVPVSTATDKDGTKLIVTQYEGSVIESTGLIKMDFLGLKTLSIIKEALENIKLTKGIDLDIEAIPLDDAATYKLYCEGKTTGTFQFESPGMQRYLIELQPSTFEDLIAMNALYRPGPMDYIPQFISRKHGQTPIVYDIPCMEQYLKDTYGITVYQEQVMLLSRQLAGFTRGQSDTLRKAMGKKQIEKMNHLEGLFYEGGEKNGHDRKVLNKIWEDWKKFASYAFNKSHATCYSWVAYQTAYLKANYPSEYMAAVLSRNLNDVDKLSKFMDECKSMGIKVKGPDINESSKSFSANKQGDIRFGLGGIKGVGANAVDAIIDERNANGPFKDIYDFVERVNLSSCNRRALESFALAGAFDCFEEINREDFLSTNKRDEVFSEVLVRYGQNYQNDKMKQSNSLFGDIMDTLIEKPAIPKAEKWPNMERLRRERELVGMYLSAHPLDPYFMEIKYGCNISLDDLKNKSPELDTEFRFGGIVTGYEERYTKKGDQQFGKITIEDYSGSYELMLFRSNFTSFRNFGLVGTPIMVTGKFSKNRYNDQINMDIINIISLNDVKGKLVDRIRIQLHESDLGAIQVLKSAVGKKSEVNNCALFFRVVNDEQTSYVDLQSSYTIALNKQLMELLDELGFSYKVNF